jgi:predicted dehydrogenase
VSTVRIGFVGVGSMGQMAHLRNYVSIEDCEVVALAELRPQTAQLVARRYGVPNVFRDHREMLDAVSLDGVVASQPFAAHHALLPQIYPRVRHVFTEKPLAVSVAAGEQLVAAAAEAGCVHMVGYNKLSDPATMHALQVIGRWKASAELGALRYVRILMPPGDWIQGGFVGLLNGGDPRPEVEREPPDSDMDEQTYKQYVQFVNYYIHQVNLMRHLLGEPYTVTYAERSGVLMAVRSGSGVAGAIEMAPYRTTVGWEESALIGFERGYVKLRLPAPMAMNRAGRVEIYQDPGGETTPRRSIPQMPPVHSMRQQAIHFVKVCRGEMAPPETAAGALEDLKTARAYILLRARAE